MRVLIPGGEGSLGSALAGLLGRDPAAVYLAVDLPEVDVSDRTSFLRCVDEAKPDVVVNCAAFTNVDLCETREFEALRVNGEAPKMMAGACRDRGIRFVHVGTDYVFDGLSERPYVEDDPPRPVSAYGRTKLNGERAVLAENPRALVARTAWLYGSKKSFVKSIVARAREGEALSIVGDQYGAPTSAADLGAAIMTLLEKGAAGLVHFVNAGRTTWYDVARFALDHLGLDVPITRITTEEYVRSRPPGSPPIAPRPRFSVLDTSLYTRLTGTPPRPWQEPMQEYLNSLK